MNVHLKIAKSGKLGNLFTIFYQNVTSSALAQLRHQPHWFIKMVPRRAVKHSRGCAHGNEKVRVGKILGDRRKIKSTLSA